MNRKDRRRANRNNEPKSRLRVPPRNDDMDGETAGDESGTREPAASDAWGATARTLGRHRLALALVALVALVAVGRSLPWRAVFGALTREEATGLALAALFVLYLVRPFLLVPLSLFSLFVGYRFGLAWGLPIALAGTVLTCAVPFLLARRFRGDVGWWGRVTDASERAFDTVGGLRGMVAARLSPAPADAVSYAAGLSTVPLRTFVAGTFLGELPWATAYVLVGRSARRFADASPELGLPFLLGISALATLVAASRLVDR